MLQVQSHTSSLLCRGCSVLGTNTVATVQKDTLLHRFHNEHVCKGPLSYFMDKQQQASINHSARVAPVIC